MDERKIDQMDESYIDLFRLLREFLHVLRRLYWVPVLLALLLSGLWTLRQWRAYTPKYASEVTFTIQVAEAVSSDIAITSSYYDKATAEQLSKTFPYLVQSDLMYSKLCRAMGVDHINGTITAKTVPNTNLFTMKVTSTDPEDAKAILEQAIAVYPQVADYVIGNTAMNLLTEPTEPTAPYNAFRPLGSACRGGVIGVFLGLALILLCAVTRRTVRESEDVRLKLNRPCLGEVPRVSLKRRERSEKNVLSIENSRMPGAFLESMRSLRLKLLRELPEGGCKVILVTSTMPGEGKTTVSANLALSLARNGARVVLVDMDLRRPAVKKALGITAPSIGVATALEQKEAALGSLLLEVPGTTLKLLAGDTTKDARLTNSRKLRALVAELRGQADYVILDTPPCGLMTDSVNVARLADCALYVLGAGKAEVSSILDGLQFLGESGVEILGCVLNGVQAGGGYGYGYRYGGYGYGYGYRSGYGYGGGYGSRHKRNEKASEEG